MNSLVLGLLALVMQAPTLRQDVKLAWDPVPTATAYKVYTHGPDAAYALVGTTAETTYTVPGLAPGAYSFVVTATDGVIESAYSNEVSTILASPGPRIEWLGVMNLTATTAYISWTTSTDCRGSVQIGTAEPLARTVVANNLGTTDHAVIVGALASRTHYLYRVVSVCGAVTVQSGIRSFNTK